jgi:ABC-2 type transport system permease protein
LESSSGTFAAIGNMMPSAWAMDGYQNILIRGLGLESVWTPTLMLLAYALGFFMLAVWRFRNMDV